jgi:hypothetical protein
VEGKKYFFALRSLEPSKKPAKSPEAQELPKVEPGNVVKVPVKSAS